MKKKEGEIIKPLPGFNDYFVSNYGNIYSKKSGELKKLKIREDSRKRYMIAHLSIAGKTKNYLVHRLVAQTFLENPLNLPEINHKDNNPQNNHVSNLEWCTRKQNLLQSYKTMSPVRNFNNCKLYKNKQLLGEFQSINEAARYATQNYNLSFSSLVKYLRCGEFEIMLDDTLSNRKLVSDGKPHKLYNTGLINLYCKDEFVGQYNSVEEIYREYKKQGIIVCKPYLLKYGRSGDYRIERIAKKCND